MKRGPLKVFYSYAHEDEAARDRIDGHLALLARQNLIVGWHDRHIVPGAEWNEVIGERLASADIVLLLVSRAFMASEYVNQVEIPEAMRAHASGSVRVVPILIEETPGWEKAAFAKLQILPTGAKPITWWEDPVQALRDIGRGVGRVAKDIIIAGGGPFEFGAHEFTEAELAGLPKAERERAAMGLERLREDLNRTIPARSYEANLLAATWKLRQFGRPGRLPLDEPEALFYMAQVISSFDLVALQGVDRDLRRLEALVEALGPDWRALVTDVAPGVMGNRARFAFLYYQPRLEFRNFSSQVILPAERGGGTEQRPVQQFARPPLVAAFRSGAWEFQACTAHIVFGGSDQKAMEERMGEIRKLGDYLRARSQYEETDLLLLGDFQMGKRESPILEALRENGVEIPEELLHPTNLSKTMYYDLIGFTSAQRAMPLGLSRPRSGAYDLFQHVLRDEDLEVYEKSDSFRKFAEAGSQAGSSGSGAKADLERKYRMWKISLISDHLPLWAEMEVGGGEGR